jgi:uncharacterized protein (DUF2147 family)
LFAKHCLVNLQLLLTKLCKQIMKKLISVLTLVILFTTKNMAQTSPADAVVGYWFNAEKDGKVQIYKQGTKYYGKLVWMKNPRKDTENPDTKLKTRDLQGVVLLNNFSFENPAWEKGTIYDPKNGKTYSCIIKKKNDNTLDIRGFIGISLIGRTTTWTRTTHP